MLKNKVAVITGSSRGIGLAIAKTFADNGAKVLINCSKPGKDLDKAKETLKSMNADFMVFEGDMSDRDTVRDMFASVLERYGTVDILVNNAGINRDKPLMFLSEEDWDSVMDVNLKSVYFSCKEVLRTMIKNKSGRVINVSSITARLGREGQTNYGASKAGMIGFTRCLAREVAKYNILVNSLVVGLIDTLMTKRLPREIRKDLNKIIPLARIGKPEEVASACLFLASDLSSYITGTTLDVSGGGGI
ncbi:MAG: 3-oxoacyl-ACP reductase FabG [Pseudomonadota bacterium]